MSDYTFCESTTTFIDTIRDVHRQQTPSEDIREKRRYVRDVLEPIKDKISAAVNNFGFPFKKVAKALVDDPATRTNAVLFAKEFVWWFGHFDPSFTDERDVAAFRFSKELCDNSIVTEPKASAFTGIGECFQTEHRYLRADEAHLCFLILQEADRMGERNTAYWQQYGY